MVDVDGRPYATLENAFRPRMSPTAPAAAIRGTRLLSLGTEPTPKLSKAKARLAKPKRPRPSARKRSHRPTKRQLWVRTPDRDLDEDAR